MQALAKKIPVFDHFKFLAKVSINRETECWEWKDSLIDGYGRFRIKGSKFLAHRVSFHLFNKGLSNKLMIDHKCRNRKCINPDHLRQVTHRINNLENTSNKIAELNRRTHCKNGHEFTGIVKYGYRFCKICSDIRTINSNKKKAIMLSNS